MFAAEEGGHGKAGVSGEEGAALVATAGALAVCPALGIAVLWRSLGPFWKGVCAALRGPAAALGRYRVRPLLVLSGPYVACRRLEGGTSAILCPGQTTEKPGWVTFVKR